MRMNLQIVGAATSLLGLSCVAGPASSHHAVQAQFDQDNVTTITGVMTRVMWINPHVRWFMDVEDENGNVTTWNISGAGPAGFRRSGISGRDVFKTRETYTATIALARDGSNFRVHHRVCPSGRAQDRSLASVRSGVLSMGRFGR